MTNQKILVKKFLVEIDSECFATYFETKISKSKIFLHYNFFLGLRQFFHLCGQFIEYCKNLKFLDEKIKIAENLRGIISVSLTMNLDEKLLLFLTRHYEYLYFPSLWTVHQKLKKMKFSGDETKAVENFPGSFLHTEH